MKRENAAKRYYKRNMIILIAVFVPMLLLSLIPCLAYIGTTNEYLPLLVLPIIFGGTFIPFIIYYVVKFIHYANVNFVHIKKGTVVDCDSHNLGRYGTYIGFIVEYENEYGNKHTVTTKHCYTKADGYFGKTVTIGQDPSNGEWIILE